MVYFELVRSNLRRGKFELVIIARPSRVMIFIYGTGRCPCVGLTLWLVTRLRVACLPKNLSPQVWSIVTFLQRRLIADML